jgi:hypothetical protein
VEVAVKRIALLLLTFPEMVFKNLSGKNDPQGGACQSFGERGGGGGMM